MTPAAFRVLLIMTVVLVVAAVAVVAPRLGGHSSEEGGGRLFPGLMEQADRIASLSILSGGETLTLNLAQSGWRLAERGDYPANGERVWRTVLGLSELRLVEPKTADPDQYARLDVGDAGAEDSRAREVRVRDAAGEMLAHLIVGRRKQQITALGGGGVYVRRPGEAQSWLASGELAIGHDAASWLDSTIMSVPVTRARRITVRQADGASLEIQRDSAEDRAFQVINLAPSLESNPRALERLGAAFDGLVLDDVRPAADFDFAPSRSVTARLETFDGLSITARSVKQGEEIWALFEADAPAGQPLAAEEAERLQERLQGWAFRLKPFQARNLRMTEAGAVQPTGTQADETMQLEQLGLDPDNLPLDLR